MISKNTDRITTSKRDSVSLELSQSFSSERIRGFGQWKDFVRENFPWLEMRNCCGDDFRAKADARSFGTSALTTISAGASEVVRTSHLADMSDTGYIKLMWQMSGQLELQQDRRSCVIEVGQATVCDSARPYNVRLSDNARFAVLILPHDACPGWERISQRLCGTPLKDTGTMRAALGALMALSDAPGEAGEEDTDTAVRAIQWMLSTSLHRAASTPNMSNLPGIRLNKAQSHILEHVGDPSLTADDLAAALCMSRRSLYMLFKEYQLTPGKMIHDIRLERCYQALKDPLQRHRKITDIAFDSGFRDHATFSRQFKVQYGMTPSEARL